MIKKNVIRDRGSLRHEAGQEFCLAMRYFPVIHSNTRYGGTLDGRTKAKLVDINYVSHRTRSKSVAVDKYSRESLSGYSPRISGRSSTFMFNEASRRRMAVHTRALFWAEEI